MNLEKGQREYGEEALRNERTKIENPGDVDEAKWDKAKKLAHEQYDLSEDSDRFWKIVQGIYKKLTGE